MQILCRWLLDTGISIAARCGYGTVAGWETVGGHRAGMRCATCERLADVGAERERVKAENRYLREHGSGKRSGKKMRGLNREWPESGVAGGVRSGAAVDGAVGGVQASVGAAGGGGAGAVPARKRGSGSLAGAAAIDAESLGGAGSVCLAGRHPIG